MGAGVDDGEGHDVVFIDRTDSHAAIFDRPLTACDASQVACWVSGRARLHSKVIEQVEATQLCWLLEGNNLSECSTLAHPFTLPKSR